MSFKLDYVQPVSHNGTKIQCIEASNIQVELTFWKLFIICFVLGANPPLKVMVEIFNRIWGAKVDEE